MHNLLPLPSTACLFPPRSVSLSRSLPSRSDDCWAAAALGQVLRLSLVSSPATSTQQVLPPLLFPSLMLCEAEHRNPNLKLFSYLTSLLTSKFLQKLLGVHVYTHVPFTGSAPAVLALLYCNRHNNGRQKNAPLLGRRLRGDLLTHLSEEAI